jgi:formylglycine-generating enzyme required for sulfatase activity
MKYILLSLILVPTAFLSAQDHRLESLDFSRPESFTVSGLTLDSNKKIVFPYEIPLFSMLIDSGFYNSYCAQAQVRKGMITFHFNDTIEGQATFDSTFTQGIRYIIRFTNHGKADHKIENLVPLGEGPDKVYITADGTKEWPQYLCRSRLYRPGYGPIGVVLPDNAWHLGFADFSFNDTLSLTALARRTQREKDKTSIDRWAVTLKPNGWVEYTIWLDIHTGDWHEGLKLMFQERWLYDLPAFDNTLFERVDLQWMRSRYLMLLQFAWDKQYYDYLQQKFTFNDDFFAYDFLTGGWDIFTLWPTWPRLGLDQRNQWDMYRDLPGGIPALRKQSDSLHSRGRKYFISYNPWDESGRREDHMKGMEDLLRAIDADGVVLDTRGASSKELQETADRIKAGIIMYSEGMAIPRDMPGIVSGRVHDALVMPPPLNLNKLIKPDFAIFRVLQLADDRIHRELAVAFFNGYGVEVNTMRPGRPDWITDEYRYMGKTTKLLRENDAVFHNDRWTPLLTTLIDSIYVNRWESDYKTLFTILSLKPEGFNGILFEIPVTSLNYHLESKKQQMHWIDLWNHQELSPSEKNGMFRISVILEPFDRSWLNTRLEGQVGCIALLPDVIKARFIGDSLIVTADGGTRLVITAGNPSYQNPGTRIDGIRCCLSTASLSHKTLTKIVVQLFDKDELMDEKIIIPGNSVPRKISQLSRTGPVTKPPPGMVYIPSGTFRWYTRRDPSTLDPFIAFPDFSDTISVQMQGFYIDKYPVTNFYFAKFLESSGYRPSDTTNFLRHWIHGAPPKGEEYHPVVWISREDASAYAAWAGKRLPEEIEWQYAAQGTDMRKYPWGNSMDSLRCNYNLNYSTPVNCYPNGASLYGVMDMIGNVWQMTNDVYDNGCYYYTIIRGGSYYHPKSSIWYVAGGPLPVDHPEMLLLISPGLDRNATVGFRCVVDTQ